MPKAARFADLAAGSQAASTARTLALVLRARGVRHQGRRRPVALLAAGRPRGGPVARLRGAVRRHAQDGDLRPAARAQPPGLTAGLVRVDPVRPRTRLGCAGRAVGAGPARSQAASRVPQRGEHRDHPAGHGGGSPGDGLWPAGGGAAGVHGGAAAHAEPCAVQEPAVPGRGGGGAGDGHARDRPAGGPRAPDAADGGGVRDRVGGDRGLAAAQWLRERVGRVPARSSPPRGHARPCGSRCSARRDWR